MELSFQKNNIPIYIAIALSIAAFTLFLFQSMIGLNPLVIFAIGLFLLIPYRHENILIRRLIFIMIITFSVWILMHLGFAAIPFTVSLLLAYLFDPVVTFLTKHKFPRWLASLIIILLFVGIVSTVAVLVFPMAFLQLDDAIKRISGLVNTASKYLESNKFHNWLASMGIPKDILKSTIEKEFIPKIEGMFSVILQALLSLLTSISLVGTQVVNAVLIPILTFYLLKDFPKIKSLLSQLLEKKNAKLLIDLKKINVILHRYIGMVLISSTVVATLTSVFFTIFGLPYPVVLGIICGFLNPIPFLGTISSLIICSISIILLNPENVGSQILILTIIIAATSFINAYLIEPNVAGKIVGIHPVILIAAVFIFGSLFGFVGIIIATPSTAILMMFFNEWKNKTVSFVRKETASTETGPE